MRRAVFGLVVELDGERDERLGQQGGRGERPVGLLGLLGLPRFSGGATPMLPKNGRMGMSMPGAKCAIIFSLSSGMILVRAYGKSSGRNPAPGRNVL